MDLQPVCQAVQPLTHSAPGLRWWLGLNAAEQGAWIGGLGAFAAAVAAVGVALLQASWARKQQREVEVRRTRLLAIDLVEVVTRLKSEINAARRIIPDVLQMIANQKIDRELVRMTKLEAVALIPRGLALEQLPQHIGESMAQLASIASSYNQIVKLLDDLDEPLSPEVVKSLLLTFNLRPFLDGVQESLAQTAETLAAYSPALTKVDFRDRGED